MYLCNFCGYTSNDILCVNIYLYASARTLLLNITELTNCVSEWVVKVQGRSTSSSHQNLSIFVMHYIKEHKIKWTVEL